MIVLSSPLGTLLELLLNSCMDRLVSFFFFFSSRRRHTRFDCDWSSDVCSSDLTPFWNGDMPGHEFVDPRLRLESTSRGAGIREWLRWRLNRLRCMTPAEVSHRLLRALSMQAERAGLVGSEVVPPADLATTPRPWVHAAAKVDAARYLAAADCVAAGKLDLFALQDVGLDSPPRWNRDPKTGVEAPLKFGKLLDYRNTRLVGDIKYLWELNRHLHLVTLAQAYALSRDVRYFHVIWQHLESWFAACPYPMGPNWSSALEAAIRLINWSVTWQLLGGARSPLFEDTESIRFRQRWLESVYQHARFVRGHFSRSEEHTSELQSQSNLVCRLLLGKKQ